MTELIDYSERMTRAAIRELPDGVYSFLDHIDDDGIDVGKPIPLAVTVTKSGDQILVDWTGSSPQVKGAINNTLSFTKSASYCAIRSILPADIPNNEGVFRAIEVTAPPGTIAVGVLPAACAARGLTGFRMVDCMFGALAQMLPDKVFASSDGGMPVSRSAVGMPTGGPSSISISPAAHGADGPMPTVSTAIPTSTPTWPRNRSR
jgi:N-methylhydantoinase B